MPMFQIKSRLNGSVLFQAETESLKLCVKAAVSAGANLRNADFQGADLRDADLRNADLRNANLRNADFHGADLRNANLQNADLWDADFRDANLLAADFHGADLRDASFRNANLRNANLRNAYFQGADLRDANLRNANLRDADLRDANLRNADFHGANLRNANLTPIRDDLWAVLCASPREVPALRQALVDGCVDGLTYHGDCACLVGTLANARRCAHTAIPGLSPSPRRAAERFFFCIKKGDTPATSQFAALAVQWIDEWTINMQSAFAKGD